MRTIAIITAFASALSTCGSPPPKPEVYSEYREVKGWATFRIPLEYGRPVIGLPAGTSIEEGLKRQWTTWYRTEKMECVFTGHVDVCVPYCPSRFERDILDTNQIVKTLQRSDDGKLWVFLVDDDDAFHSTDRSSYVKFTIWSSDTGVLAFGFSDPQMNNIERIYVRTSPVGVFQREQECVAPPSTPPPS